MSKRRVVVTGMGIISPVGNDIATAWQNIVEGRSGIGPVTSFDASAYATRIAGEVRDFDPVDAYFAGTDAPDDERRAIAKDFKFEDFHRTLGFINAVGFMANRQDHHPDLEAGYGHCRVSWSTHDVGGLSMNDLVCAAKVEALLAG